MKDKILEMLFDNERWKEALNKGALKGIGTSVLRELMSPQGRTDFFAEIVLGRYHIERPHTAKIPKDTPGEFRTVFINNNKDRIFLSLVNDLLFEIAGDMVHPQCKSYQKGVGCGKVVTKASQMIETLSGKEHKVIGWKSDLSKYFDSVPIEFIDEAFDKVEERFGPSKVVDVVREYYHNNHYYDSELKQEAEKYQSLKQGCAVASWLADVMLYHIDEQLSAMDGYYVRYSDDTLFIGKDYEKAMDVMHSELAKMQMKLNPKKVEYLTNNRWFKFLGFAIKGKDISLGGNRIKTFVKEVKTRTLDKIKEGVKLDAACRSVQSWLYRGDGQFSWATGVLKTINVQSDVNRLNGFVLDCLRAVNVGRQVSMSDIGGLGWVRNNDDGCIGRGRGRRIRTLRTKTTNRIDGYRSLGCMRNALLYSRSLYDCMVREI